MENQKTFVKVIFALGVILGIAVSAGISGTIWILGVGVPRSYHLFMGGVFILLNMICAVSAIRLFFKHRYDAAVGISFAAGPACILTIFLSAGICILLKLGFDVKC